MSPQQPVRAGPCWDHCSSKMAGGHPVVWMYLLDMSEKNGGGAELLLSKGDLSSRRLRNSC